jgi:hypothetical protein
MARSHLCTGPWNNGKHQVICVDAAMIKNWSNITFLLGYQQKRTPNLVLDRYMDELEFDLEFIIVERKNIES